ncbi:hypothetical protein GW916_15285 [bacterium]|nr:hypothetical protein [bacterium]
MIAFKRLLVIFGLFFSFSIYAIRPAMDFAIEVGGDKVFSGELDTGKTRSFSAGNLALLSGGGVHNYTLLELPWQVRGMLGFKAAGVTAGNGSYDFFRWFVEVSQFYPVEPWSMMAGAGLTYHFSNSVNAKGVLESLSTEIDPSLGAFFQVDYVFDKRKNYVLGVKKVLLGLRYTMQNYTQKAFSVKLDANSFGVHMNMFW